MFVPSLFLSQLYLLQFDVIEGEVQCSVDKPSGRKLLTRRGRLIQPKRVVGGTQQIHRMSLVNPVEGCCVICEAGKLRDVTHLVDALGLVSL